MWSCCCYSQHGYSLTPIPVQSGTPLPQSTVPTPHSPESSPTWLYLLSMYYTRGAQLSSRNMVVTLTATVCALVKFVLWGEGRNTSKAQHSCLERCQGRMGQTDTGERKAPPWPPPISECSAHSGAFIVHMCFPVCPGGRLEETVMCGENWALCTSNLGTCQIRCLACVMMPGTLPPSLCLLEDLKMAHPFLAQTHSPLVMKLHSLQSRL